jgi:hypothetical protein
MFFTRTHYWVCIFNTLSLLVFSSINYCYSQNEINLERQWAGIEKPQPRFSTRDFFFFAFEATAANWHPERVEAALRLAATKQDRNPNSKTYGNFAWYWEDKSPDDRNCVEFCMQKGALLWILYKDRLTPGAREVLSEMFKYAIEGIRLHRVATSYSNIYLKKTWNCIALGEATGRDDLAKEGYQMLQTWLNYTKTNGISEYLSPTYYAVDMENIGLIARHSKNVVVREKARLAMQYIWAQVAANWFEPAERLGGAHSRDYDYLFGRGNLDEWVARAGWSTFRKPTNYSFYKECWVAPEDWIKSDVLETYPRMVRQRWGVEPWQSASQWLGKTVAIGTAGAAYHDAMDKTFVVLFSGADLPTCYYLMDARMDPYGKKRYPTGGGHLKAHHIFPFFTSVQNKNEALFLAAASASSRTSFQRSGTNLSCWLSHIVIPPSLPVYIGSSGNLAKIDGILKLKGINEPIFIRQKSAVAAFKILYAITPQDEAAELEIVDDTAEYNARRITCIHSKTPPKEGRVFVAVYSRVAEGLSDEEFRGFIKMFGDTKTGIKREGNIVEVYAQSDLSILRLKADIEKEKRLEIEGDEPEARSALLRVNSKELGLPIIERAILLK